MRSLSMDFALPGQSEGSRRVRVLYLITRAETGGAQSHVGDLLEGFADRFEMLLAVGEEGHLTQRARELGVGVFLMPDLIRTVSPFQDLRALRHLVKLVQSARPDLVHAHSTKAGMLGRIAARIARAPSVFTAH